MIVINHNIQMKVGQVQQTFLTKQRTNSCKVLSLN